jgi:hypothetical protein
MNNGIKDNHLWYNLQLVEGRRYFVEAEVEKRDFINFTT